MCPSRPSRRHRALHGLAAVLFLGLTPAGCRSVSPAPAATRSAATARGHAGPVAPGDERVPGTPRPSGRSSEDGPPEDALRGDLTLLAQGANALAEDRPIEAEQLLAAYLVDDPACGMALFLHGVALLDLGRIEEARSALQAAVEADPDDASGHAVLARIEFERGDLEAAARSLERAVACAPEEGAHWTSLGLVYFQQDRWNEAYDALLTAVELDPEDAAAHRALGRLYVGVAEFELAERAYRTALALQPGDVGLHVALAHVLRDLARPAEALDVYRAALLLEPENPALLANVASSLLELHRTHEARDAFERALALLPRSGVEVALVSLNYGGLLESIGDLDGAEAAYLDAAEAAPDLGRAHEARGMLALHLGDERQAVASLREAQRLSDLEPEHLLEYTLLLERRGEWQAAAEGAELLLQHGRGEAEHGDDDPEQVYRCARLFLHSRQEGVHDVQRAVQLLRSLVAGDLEHHPGAWELLAEALAETGALEEAIGAMDGALAVARPDGPVRTRFEEQRARLVDQLAARR